MNHLLKIQALLKASAKKALDSKAIFYKTGPGSYAEHDQFIGVSVPVLRQIAKEFHSITLDELQALLESKINEERLLALIILVNQYQSSNEQEKEKRFQFYLRQLKHVNNWNLVDASAHLIIGEHLLKRDRKILLTLAKSDVLWERRISIVSTWYFIRNDDLDWTFKLAGLLLKDKQDLIHKATGWMLREAGKRDESQLTAFLDQHVDQMPRTMLRYAIEKFDERKRKSYLLKSKT